MHFTNVDSDIEPHNSPINEFQADAHVSKHVCLGIPSKSSINVPLDINMNEGEFDNPVILLKNLRERNANRIIIAHLNINFLANKFEALRSFCFGED